MDFSTKESFWGNLDGPDLSRYKIGSLMACDKDRVNQYAREIAPNHKVDRFCDYRVLRTKDHDVTVICEKDKDSDRIFLLEPNFRSTPLYAK
jgi:hypothetical protein